MKRIVVSVVLGALIVAGIVVARLPATLISNAVTDASIVTATQTRGTIWQGQTYLTTPALELGTLQWTLAPLTLFTGRASVDWRLTGTGLQLGGNANAGFTTTSATVSGRVDAATLNSLLAPYDIRVGRGVQIDTIDALIESGWPSALDGRVLWQGGDVTYTLSGRREAQRLPPMTAILDLDTSGDSAQPRAHVRADGDPILLMRAALQRNGFAKVGVTRHFTDLVAMPWPGSDPDHAIVLEVEEQVF